MKMRQYLIDRGYIPFDKSWLIRVGVIDLLTGYDDTINFLGNHYDSLSDDLKALYEASHDWQDDVAAIDVGESATLYRFLKFASHKLNYNREFIRRGTLEHRRLGDDRKTLDATFEELVALPTSQWSSAYAIFDYAIFNRTHDTEVENPKPKLRLTFDAIRHWENARASSKGCKIIHDDTLLRQAVAYVEYLRNGNIEFIPQHAEDYCFSRAFGLMSAEQGASLWSNLRDHESDRLDEMEQQLASDTITSKDHRVVQAIAMMKKGKVSVEYSTAVNKSWPQFWRFLKDAPSLIYLIDESSGD